MAIKLSTGLRDHLLTQGRMLDFLEGGLLRIYSGTVPAEADASTSSNTLLCEISLNGTGSGLTWEPTSSDGMLSKAVSDVWSGMNAASGVASFFRYVRNDDTGGSSATETRIQGTVGVFGADMNLSNTTLTVGAPQAIQYFYVMLPKE